MQNNKRLLAANEIGREMLKFSKEGSAADFFKCKSQPNLIGGCAAIADKTFSVQVLAHATASRRWH